MNTAGKLEHLKGQIISDLTNVKSSDNISIKCVCGKISVTSARNLYRKWATAPYLCKSCSVKLYASDSSRIAKFKESFSKIANTPEHKEKCKNAGKKFWEDPAFAEDRNRVKHSVSVDNKTNPSKIAARAKASESFMAKNGKEHLDKIRKIAGESIKKKCKNDPEYVKILQDRLNQQPRVSSLQTILYSILDDLNIKYFREYPDKPPDSECIIGPYNFDCVIPREGKTTLLIECQGEYWHSLPKTSQNDKSKASYINNNLPDKYEIKYLWEHEFKCVERIAETIKYWTGLVELEIVNFEPKDIIIKKCAAAEYKLLLAKYHYLANGGRGGLAYGAYLGGELIAVCVFSPPIRQDVASSLGYKNNETRELSRLCIHPRYQKKNFASWFVSRCIKQLDSKYRCIVSYCDTTFNHDGAVYKACNFALDSKVKPDYWYVDDSGWVMHKKTLYQHAVNMKMKEKEYAETNGYNRVYGKEKLRFVYKRSKDK